MRNKFVPDHGGMKQLLQSEMVRKELRRRADKVAAEANNRAPVGETGELSQSHRVDEDTSPGTKGASPRARARVYTNKKYAIAVESATGYFSSSLDAGGD